MQDTVMMGQTAAAAAQTLMFSVLGIILAATALWQSRDLVARRLRRRARAAATARAEGLLREMLGEETYATMLARGYLDVPSMLAPPGRRLYRVAYPPDGVLVLEDGHVVEHLCLVPRQWMPDADVFLTHRALLEGDEEKYLRLAVHTPLAEAMLTPGRM